MCVCVSSLAIVESSYDNQKIPLNLPARLFPKEN